MSPKTRVLGAEHGTRWAWKLRPTHSGEQNLQLSVLLLVEIKGDPTANQILPLGPASVEVKGTLLQRIVEVIRDIWQGF